MFKATSGDHAGSTTPHVHGVIGSGEVIVELIAGEVRLSRAHGTPIRGQVTKREVQIVLATAAEIYDELLALWKASQPS